MAKKKLNYVAERKEAQQYADTLKELVGLERAEWLRSWGIAYNAYLAGIRRRALGKTGDTK